VDQLCSIQMSGRVSSVLPAGLLRATPEPVLEQELHLAPAASGRGKESGSLSPQSSRSPQYVTMNPRSSAPQLKLSLAASAVELARPLEALEPALVPVPAPVCAVDIRLRKHADYQRVYQATRKQFSSSMSWFLAVRASIPVATANSPGPRVGLTAGKVLGKAHERNLIKRRMREAVRHAIHELPEGVDLILHPKRSVMSLDFVKLEAEVLRIFRQAATQTREMTTRFAQSKPVPGPEAVQNPGRERTQKVAPARAPGEPVTPS
jgi:ribonuclease P protein component